MSHRGLLVATLAITPQTNALSLGEARLNSWLGEPLDASIKLQDSDNLTEQDLLVRQLRGQRALKLGLENAVDDEIYRIRTETDSNGQLWVKASSSKPINEPYVNFVLQLEMPGGSISREYTLLIDMPPAQSSRAASVATPLVTAPPSEQYIIQAGDTLGQVAQKLRPDPMIRLQAVMQTLHRSNLEAFERGDANRLIVGASLRLPSAAEWAAMPRRSGKHASVDASVPKATKAPATETTTVTDAPATKANGSELQTASYPYRVRAGDTLSQIAYALRPSKKIPLPSVIRTLQALNRKILGPTGDRLNVGDTLKIPADAKFYQDAGLRPPSPPEPLYTPHSVAAESVATESKDIPTPATASTPVAVQQPSRTPPLMQVAKNSSDLNASLAQLQQQLQRHESNQQQTQALLQEIMAVQQQQLALIQKLRQQQLTPAPAAGFDWRWLPWALLALITSAIGLAGWRYRLVPRKTQRATETTTAPITAARPLAPQPNQAQEPIVDTGAAATIDREQEVSLELDLALETESESSDKLKEKSTVISSALSNVRLFSRDTSANEPLPSQDDELEPLFADETELKPAKSASFGEMAAAEQAERDRQLREKLAAREISSITPSDNSFEIDELYQLDGFKQSPSVGQSESELDNSVIWQANIYAAYGQHSRAIGLLTDELEQNPDKLALKLALLDVHASCGHLDEFEKLAAKLPKDDPSVQTYISDLREQYASSQEAL